MRVQREAAPTAKPHVPRFVAISSSASPMRHTISRYCGSPASCCRASNAIEAIKTDEAPKVMEQMRKTPVNDFFAKGGKIRIDGRMVHDMYLFEVKKPEESKGEWDLYKLIATVPGDEAFRPLDKGGCPLVKSN